MAYLEEGFFFFFMVFQFPEDTLCHILESAVIICSQRGAGVRIAAEGF